MGITEFFKALFGGQPPAAGKPVEMHVGKGHALGHHAASSRRVALITMLNELRLHCEEKLKPVVEAAGYVYDDHPSIETGTGSRIVIMEALPATDAKLHTKYDQIVRIKKSMGKTNDVLCIVAQRENFKKYPRGTYPGLLYFCLQPDDYDHRDPDLPPEGLKTIEGPLLFNFADMPAAIGAMIKEFSIAKPRGAS